MELFVFLVGLELVVELELELVVVIELVTGLVPELDTFLECIDGVF